MANKSRIPPQAKFGEDDPEDNRNPEYPVVYDFPATSPIFWGPGQDTKYVDGEEGYVKPPPERFDNLIAMTIPVVIRGITGHNSAYEPDDDDPPPDTGGQCFVGPNATILLGYTQGMDGNLIRGPEVTTGTVIPVVYPSGYPCYNACGGNPPNTTCLSRGYAWFKEAVILNEVSENYDTDMTTQELIEMASIFEEHNKLTTQGYVGKGKAGLLVTPIDGTLNVDGTEYPIGCPQREFVNVTAAASDTYEILGQPTTSYNPFGFDDPPYAGPGVSKLFYFPDHVGGLTGYTAKFTIFWIISCRWFNGSAEDKTVYGLLYRGWFEEIPPDGTMVGGYLQSPQPPRRKMDGVEMEVVPEDPPPDP